MRISDWSSDVCSSDLLAEQQLLGQWSLQAFLNDARHRTGTHFRVVATIGDPQARRFIDIQLHVLVAELLFERSEEHTSELQSLMRISYAVFCLKKKNEVQVHIDNPTTITATN